MEINNKNRDIKQVSDEWRLREIGIQWNNNINYYGNVDRNFDFYAGNQWGAIKSKDLPLCVFNICKRVADFQIASILSQNVIGKFSIVNVGDKPLEDEGVENTEKFSAEEEKRQIADILTQVCEQKWETDKMNTLLRDALRDGACTGDFCAYTYWDENKNTGQTYAKGDFCTELVDGGNVFFGNPNDKRVDKQPYILITGRAMVADLRREAKNNGLSQEEINDIVSDEDNLYQAGTSGKTELENNQSNGKCNYIIKYWKETTKVEGTKDEYKTTIMWNKSTKLVKIKKDIDLGISKYPIAWGNWTQVKNNYHGQALITEVIPNQIFINKQFAMTMLWLQNMAYGKVAYDTTRIPSWTNQVNAAIPVNGDTTGAVQQMLPGQMNSIVLSVIDRTIQQTKECLGSTDASLGDINPERASGASILAVQKQSAIPLENVKQSLYQFVEDIYAIWGEFILKKYIVDRVVTMSVRGRKETTLFNAEPYNDLLTQVRIDVGPSAYWSELASLNTLDNLLAAEKIDFIDYLERVPIGMIPDKERLMEKIKQQTAQAMNQPPQPVPEIMPPPMPQPVQPPMPQPIPQVMPQPTQPTSPPDYEIMAQFIESLPPEIQQQLMALPPQEMEQAVIQLMNQA